MECMHRWDPDNLDSLPDYMKTVFKSAWDILEKCESEGIAEEGSSFNVQGLLEEVINIYINIIQISLSYVIVDINIFRL